MDYMDMKGDVGYLRVSQCFHLFVKPLYGKRFIKSIPFEASINGPKLRRYGFTVKNLTGDADYKTRRRTKRVRFG